MRDNGTEELTTTRTIGNIIWIIFGGLLTAILWTFIGCVFSITIIGIPLGRISFRMAKLTLAPFGKSVEYGGGAPSLLANIVWIIVAGIPAAILYVILGCIYCITLVGIPFGIQLFKMAKLSLMPFGARIVDS